MHLGQLIVITGPSGVGKGTLVRSLLARHSNLYLSVSATTRSPRGRETHGKDYYFLTRPQFEEAIAAGDLLEWAEYAGNYYGTPREAVEEKIRLGQSVLLEIEVVGAQKILQTFPQALRLFILPPSLAELERRLRDRDTDSEEAIAQRLHLAQQEIATCDEFDLCITNDNLAEALQAIEAAIFPQKYAAES